MGGSVVELDTDAVLCALEQRYRASKLEAMQAKARYASMIDTGTTNAATRRNAYVVWQEQDARCRVLAHRLAILRRRLDV